MRLDDRIAALRSDERLAALAARLGMREPQRFAVVRLAAPQPSLDRPRSSRCSPRWPDSSAAGKRRTQVTPPIACITARSRASPDAREGLLLRLRCSSRAFLAWRLYDVQVLHGPLYAREALAQRSDTVEVFARRGSILDRNGNVLVRSLPSESVYAVPREIADPDATAAKLAKIFGKLDPATIAALHDQHSWFVWIARKVPHDQAERVRALELDGIAAQRRGNRAARRYRRTAGVDRAGFRRHRRKRSRRHRVRRTTLLRGRSGSVTLEADEFGRPIPFGRERSIKPAQPGSTLELTIDSYLQFVAERALDQAGERVPRARRHRHRHGSVDRRSAGDGERARLRSQPLLEVQRRRSGATARLWTPTSRARPSSSSPRRRRSNRGKVTLADALPGARHARSRRPHDSQRGRRLHGRQRRQRNARTNHRVLAQRRRGRSRYVDRRARRSTRWNAEPASATPTGRRIAGRKSRHRSAASRVERFVAGDDVVRARRFGNADRDGALLLRDRQRRPA